jgi:5-methyltetrahydrofolate--homocysteine methyltransferase
MISALERIQAGEVLVADGAMGTMLFAHGLGGGRCPEEYNLTHPEILETIARQYLEAGADIVQTNTFGGSPLKLAQYGLDAQTDTIVANGVKAVKQAVGGKAYVAASCGPSGKLLKPFGDCEPEAMKESFLRQMTAMINAGADLVCVETMTDLTEATLAVEAAREISADIPIMATMTFDPTPRGFYTVMGVTIEAAAKELKAAGANIIGSNCGNGIQKMIAIAVEFKQRTALPVIIQSNAGVPELKEGKPFYPETPEFMGQKTTALIEAGVAVIGGCCGTTPDHIRAIRAAVDNARH